MMLGILETASRIYLSRKDFNGLAIIEFATKVRVYMHSFKYKGNSKKGNRELKCLANAANDYTKKNVWMSHQDAVVKLPKNFRLIASTQDSKYTIIENSRKHQTN